MRSHIDWRGEQNIVYKCVETSLQPKRFNKLEGKPERKRLKDNIYEV